MRLSAIRGFHAFLVSDGVCALVVDDLGDVAFEVEVLGVVDVVDVSEVAVCEDAEPVEDDDRADVDCVEDDCAEDDEVLVERVADADSDVGDAARELPLVNDRVAK
jgi:hypothetical protein